MTRVKLPRDFETRLGLAAAKGDVIEKRLLGVFNYQRKINRWKWFCVGGYLS